MWPRYLHLKKELVHRVRDCFTLLVYTSKSSLTHNPPSVPTDGCQPGLNRRGRPQWVFGAGQWAAGSDRQPQVYGSSLQALQGKSPEPL